MQQQNRPNIILILTDQFRGDCVGADGNPYIYTPFLDSMADRGVLFRRGYSPSPTCIPARACMVTGQMPTNAGFFTNNFAQVWDYPDTMMTQLRDGGYQTINIGKNHFKPYRSCLGFEINRVYETGRDENGEPSDYQLWLNDVTGGRVTDTALTSDNNSWVVMPWNQDPELHPSAWTADEAVRQLRHRDTTRPFYMQVSFHRPHPPLDPPAELLRMYENIDLPKPVEGEWSKKYAIASHNISPFEGKIAERDIMLAKRAYYAQITFIDRQIGKILTYLQKSRLMQNTIIVFTADHGELLGDHNMFRKGPAFEGSARVPFIVCGPGVKHSIAKSVENEPVSLIDLLPTFLDYAGITPRASYDGVSLKPLLSGDCCPENWERKYIYGENYRDMKAFGIQVGWDFVVDKQYKYVWNSITGDEYFFDLENDRDELYNLIAEPSLQEKIAEMRTFLIDQFKDRPGDGLLNEDGTLHSPSLLSSYRPPEWAKLSREEVLKKPPVGMGFPSM